MATKYKKLEDETEESNVNMITSSVLKKRNITTKDKNTDIELKEPKDITEEISSGVKKVVRSILPPEVELSEEKKKVIGKFGLTEKDIKNLDKVAREGLEKTVEEGVKGLIGNLAEDRYPSSRDIRNLYTLTGSGNYFGIGNQIELRTYNTIVFIVTLGYFILAAFLMATHLIWGWGLYSSTVFLIVALAVLEGIGWMLLKFFITYIPVIDIIFMFILISIQLFIIFIYSSELSWISIGLINGIIGIYTSGMAFLILLTRNSMNSIKTLSPLFDGLVYIMVITLTYLTYSYMATTPGAVIWTIIGIMVATMLQYVNEITELLKGVAGNYIKTGLEIKIFATCHIFFVMYLTMITIFMVIKHHGLTFVLPIWWDPYFLGLTIPDYMFGWI